MTTTNKPKALFWIIAIIALLWNLMGLSEFIKTAFFVEMYAETYNEIQMDAIRNAPIWTDVLFGISTITGVLASIMLLMRKKMAIQLFALSTYCYRAHIRSYPSLRCYRPFWHGRRTDFSFSDSGIRYLLLLV